MAKAVPKLAILSKANQILYMFWCIFGLSLPFPKHSFGGYPATRGAHPLGEWNALLQLQIVETLGERIQKELQGNRNGSPTINISWLPKWRKPLTLPKWKTEMSTKWFSKWNDVFCAMLVAISGQDVQHSSQQYIYIYIDHHSWYVCDHMSMGRLWTYHQNPGVESNKPRGSLSCSRSACLQDKGCDSVAKGQFCLISQKDIITTEPTVSWCTKTFLIIKYFNFLNK